MIAQFPSFYPDELVYSLLARYYQRSGYLRYIFAAEDLFLSKTVRPDIEFVNQYTPAAIEMLTREKNMEQIIESHTMFPYYRFVPKERRNKAFCSLAEMQGNYYNLLPLPKSKDGKQRYLRYCPMCAIEDRKQHGETYWHRVHQIRDIRICPLHRCYLVDSDVIMSGKASPTLVNAESVVPKSNDISYCQSDIEIKIAEYDAKVFWSKVDLKSDIGVGAFLHSKMGNTPYRSVRGEQRNITLFQGDFSSYYSGLYDNSFSEVWQIQKVLNGYRFNLHEVCMIAMFLNVSVNELVNMKLPEQTQEELFDEQIYRLHEQGLKYPEIARRLNASYETVKAIGERRYKKQGQRTKGTQKGGRKALDWQRIDAETLPLVRDEIRQLQRGDIDRPQKITVYAVEKMLNLPSKRITLYLPVCKAEILKYDESQERYWAKEVVWAVNTVKSSGQPMNWKHIRTLTNMKKVDVVRCLPELQKIASVDMVELVQKMIGY